MMGNSFLKRGFRIIAITAIFLLITGGRALTPMQPYENEIVVDTPKDEWDDVNPNGACGLREAIQAANIGDDFGGCDYNGSRIIIVPHDDYYLDIVGADEDDNESGDLDIIKDMEIRADETTQAPIIYGCASDDPSCTALDRVFDVAWPATVTLHRLSIRSGGNVNEGGGIRNHAQYLILNYVELLYNNANKNGGAIYTGEYSDLQMNFSSVGFNNADVSTGYGGGIDIDKGTFLCNSSVIDYNTAGYGGGLYLDTYPIFPGAHVTIRECLIQENTANQDGGGIYNGGATLIQRSMLLHNWAANKGGNLMNIQVSYRPELYIEQTDILNGQAAQGAGIENMGQANLTLSYSTIALNQASGYGGGIVMEGQYGDVEIDHATIAGNYLSETGDGSAIAHLCEGCTAPMVRIDNSIILSPYADPDRDCYGNVNGVSHNNIERGNSCGIAGMNDNITGTDPDMGGLAPNPSTYTISYYGTQPKTYALQPTSPAIDTAICPVNYSVDQNGMPIPKDGDHDGNKDCDRGAFEYQFEAFFLPLIKK